jgi:hypothetical protein
MNQQTQWPEQQYYSIQEMAEMAAALNAQPITRYGSPAKARACYATIGTRVEIITLMGAAPIQVSGREAARRLNTGNFTF